MRLLLRLFPREWRERYGGELRDLVSDAGLTPRAAIDIARAGLTERARAARASLNGGTSMTIGPAWRHPRAWALLGLALMMPTLALIALSVPADYQLARLGLLDFANSIHLFLNSHRTADLFLVGAPALTLLLAAAPLLRVSIVTANGERVASVGVRLRWVNVAVAVVAVAVGTLLVGHILFESVLQAGA